MSQLNSDIPDDLQPLSTDLNQGSAAVPSDLAVRGSIYTPTDNAAPADIPDDLKPTDWHELATAHIQRAGLNPLKADEASQMIGIYDAYRKQFGRPQEQAQPLFGQRMVGQQQELQQQANAGRTGAENFALEGLHPAAQVMAGLETAVAPAVGLVSNAGAENIRQHAQLLQNVRGNPDSVSGVAGGIVGNLPVMSNPILAGAVAGGETYHNLEEQKAAGADISGTNEALDVAGQAVLNAAVSYLFGKNITGGMAKPIEAQLAKRIPALIARYGAKAAVGAAINELQGIVSNQVTKSTVNPEQDVLQGAERNAAFGAGMEIGMTGLHDVGGYIKGKFSSPAAPPAEATPAAPPTPEGPAATQAETPPQPSGAAGTDEASILADHQKLLDLRGQLQRGELTGDSKTQAEQTVDSLAANIQDRINTVEQTHGEQASEGLYDKIVQMQETTPAMKEKAAQEVSAGQPYGGKPLAANPNPEIRQIAGDYQESKGLNRAETQDYGKVNEDRAKKIAAWYEIAKHDPANPEVKASYDAFKKETLDQYQLLLDKGYTFEPYNGKQTTPEGVVAPYANSEDVMKDLRDNKHLYVFTGGDMPADHPLAEKIPGGGPLPTYNDVFRAVHDFFGHAKEGVGFGPRGEENAWRSHSVMYSDLAKPAMTAETRGQNSWVNFGPHGETNRANPKTTKYAEQKAVLAPAFAMGEGAPTAAERFAELTDTSKPASERTGLDHLIALGKEALTGESGTMNLKPEDLVGPGSIYHEEIKPPLEKLAGAARELFRGIRSLFPLETGAGDQATADTVREHFGRAKLDQQKAEIAFDEARNGFNKLGKGAQWAFQARMDAGAPQATPELQKIADAMYHDTNAGRQKLADLGLQAAESWHEEWWNRLWKDDPTKAATFREQMLGPGKIEGRAGFLKSRSIENWQDALTAGKVPKYDNPVEMFLATRAERQKFIAGFGAMKELAENGDIRRNTVVPPGWAKLDQRTAGPLKDILPGDGFAVAPEGVARILNNVVKPSAIGNSKVFRLLMDTNNTITQALLGLSGFHVRKVTQELINLNVARSLENLAHGDTGAAKTALFQAPTSPVEAIRTGSDIQKIMLGMKQAANPEQTRIIDAMVTGGMSAKGDSVYETQWKSKVQKAFSDGGVQGMLRAIGYSPLAANEHLMQQGIFKYVQHAKLFMGYEMAREALARMEEKAGPAGIPHSELRAEMGKISDHLDNVLGLMNRDNLFWNRTARDLATLSTLSVGWNYGSGRALAGGLMDLGKGAFQLSKGGKLADVDARRVSYLASTAALTALAGAVTTYIATGKGPQKLMDYVYPPTGDKDRKGHPVRLNTGFYTSDWFDFIHSPVETAKNKASPILHDALALLSNKDYQGVEIRHEDDVWYKQAAQVARYLGKSTTPLGVQQLINTIEGGGSESKSTPMKLAAIAGFRTAKKSYSMSDAENLMHDLMARHYEVGGRTQEQADKGKLVQQLAGDIKNKEPGAGRQLRQALREGKLQKADAERITRLATGPGGFVGDLKESSLTPAELMQVWNAADDEEKKKINWVVRGKIGRTDTLDPETKRKYLKQIIADVRVKK